MKKKIFATLSVVFAAMLVALVLNPQEAHALALKSDVEAAYAEQGFYFSDYDVIGRLNTDREDTTWGDEQRIVYLTDPESEEYITEVKVGGEYILHFIVVNDGTPKEALKNVRLEIGQGDDYDTVNLNALVFYGDWQDDTHGVIEFFSKYPVIDRPSDIAGDSWVRFEPVGKAKLYNHGGRLNGAQVNHKQLFLSSASSRGIYVGYNYQNGYLPYGKDYACEVRVRVRLKAPDSDHNKWFWSDPWFNGSYTGRTIVDNQLVEIKH